MSTLELSDEERAYIKTYPHCDKVIVHKLQGARLKAVFWRDHNESPGIDGETDCDICYWSKPPTLDPRHKYTDEQWLEAGKEDSA